jgi:hypothetical protein
MKSNPIIQAAKAKTQTKMHQLAGFLGEGSNGKVELFTTLDMSVCIELDAADVLFVQEAKEPTSPSLVFVRDDAPVLVRQQMTVAAVNNVSEGCGCECSGNGEITPQLPIGGGGGGIGSARCFANYVSCFGKCDTLYRNNPANRAICEGICADIESECTGIGRGGGGVSRNPGVTLRRR